jgi:hypothetical protein
VNKKLSLVRRQFFEAGWRCAEETVVARGDRFFITCAFEPSETAGAKSETASDPLDLLVGPILRHRRGALEDAYIRHLRGWLESIEAKGGNSLSISAGATAAMLLELEVTRLSLPSDM